MTPMDSNVSLINYLRGKHSAFDDANQEPRSNSNTQNARNVQNNTIARMKNFTIRQKMYDFFFCCQISLLLLFPRKFCCCSTLKKSTKAVFVLPTITIIFTIIGILVVCLTAPNPPGMSLLFYILRIQYDKNSQLIRFCFPSIASFG